jgi:hypothetical protein
MTLSPHDKYSSLKYLERAWEEINKLPTTTPCKNCEYLSASYCNLWKEVIPNDILSKGCDKWKFDPGSPVL